MKTDTSLVLAITNNLPLKFERFETKQICSIEETQFSILHKRLYNKSSVLTNIGLAEKLDIVDNCATKTLFYQVIAEKSFVGHKFVI